MRDSGRPRICATVAVPTLGRLGSAAAMAISQGADLLELRLDHLPKLPSADELRWCRDLGVPVVATIRNDSEGGRYKGPEAERLGCLDGIAGLFQYVDLELNSATNLRIGALKGSGSKVILSHHDFRSTPPDETLLSVACRAKALGGDVCKIATLVTCPRDTLRMLSLPTIVSPSIVVTMGREGVLGRVLAPFFGSEFTYAHPDGLPPAAPGMLSVQTMRRIYQDLEDTLGWGRPRC